MDPRRENLGVTTGKGEGTSNHPIEATLMGTSRVLCALQMGYLRLGMIEVKCAVP